MPQAFEPFVYTYQRANGSQYQRTLLLPPSYGHKRAWEQAAKSGIRSTTVEGAQGRRVDDPLIGRGPSTTAVWTGNEQEAKAGRPMGLIMHVPGKKPLLVPNAAGENVERLHERAQRHFADHGDELDIPAPMPDYTQIMHDLVDVAFRAQRGRTTYGARAYRN